MLLSAPASACPPLLRTAKSEAIEGAESDLCRLSDRYRAARSVLEKNGISDSNRIADVLAPRFINSPDWESAKAKGESSPWKVYRPAPRTWGGWEAALAYLEEKILRTRAAHAIPALTPAEAIELHRRAMDGLSGGAGRLRELPAIGNQYLDSNALTREYVEKITSPGYMTALESGRNLVRWVPTKCVDRASLGHREQPKFTRIDARRFFRDEQGIERQCGFYHYATAPRDVPRVLGAWSARAHEMLAEWSKAPHRTDLIKAVARLQRWFVAIHPFTDGNGRISRFALDYFLSSLDLPTPVLGDQNADLMLNEEEWSQEVGRGMVRHVELLERCAREPRRRGCAVVDREPPFAFFWEE